MNRAIVRAVCLLAVLSATWFVNAPAVAQSGVLELRALHYSGRPNPELLISDPTEIETLRGFLANLPPTVPPAWPSLGFRGYLMINNGVSSFPAEVRAFRGVIRIFDGGELQFFVDARGLEEYLRNRIGEGPKVGRERPQQGTPNELPPSGAEPPYEPDRWNDHDGTQDNNNCYNYACNKMTNTFAKPGRAGGYTPESLICTEYVLGAEADGLVATDCLEACAVCNYKVALVMDPGVDFHWYRQDDTGNWSHKPGETEATNLDESGEMIIDPRTADRNDYSDFCGCFCVIANPDQVTIN